MKKNYLLYLCILMSIFIIPGGLFGVNLTVENAQFRLALELFRTRNYSGALVEFKRLLIDMKSKEYADDCYYYIGSSYYTMHQYAASERNFRIVVDKYRNSKYHSPALYFLARTIYLQNRYSDAILLFDRYVKDYPAREYADNSLYWKAEALLQLQQRKKAKEVLEEVLKKYPQGNKADAARFKLKLMAMEDERKIGEKIKEEKLEKPKEEPVISEDALKDIDALKKQIENLKKKENTLLAEINDLNNQIDQLNSEINNLREIGKGTQEEQEKQIQEKINALVSWENLLKIKEKALNKLRHSSRSKVLLQYL